MPHLGPTELLLILLIVIAVFGAGKLANLGGALGKGVKDFRSAMTEPEEKGDEAGDDKGPDSATKSKDENGGEKQS